MKMKHKILGIVLSLVMLVSVMPSPGVTYAAPDTDDIDTMEETIWNKQLNIKK